jgi:hypothetical protein
MGLKDLARRFGGIPEVHDDDELVRRLCEATVMRTADVLAVVNALSDPETTELLRSHPAYEPLSERLEVLREALEQGLPEFDPKIVIQREFSLDNWGDIVLGLSEINQLLWDKLWPCEESPEAVFINGTRFTLADVPVCFCDPPLSKDRRASAVVQHGDPITTIAELKSVCDFSRLDNPKIYIHDVGKVKRWGPIKALKMMGALNENLEWLI